MKQDLYFDHLGAVFNQQIYQRHKGQLRLACQQRCLHEFVLAKALKPLRVLDIGGGGGQISQWLASLGHQVVYSEPAAAMYAQAKPLLAPWGVQMLAKSYQALTVDELGPFDLVLCNAVLEWLAEPRAGLAKAHSMMKGSGYLVVMSYNTDALKMRRLLRGHWQKALQSLPGDGTGLTPISLFSAQDMQSWLLAEGLEIVDWAGVRTVTDWLPGQHSLEDLLTLDAQLCRQDPWRLLGRYQHFICQQPRS